MKQILLRIGIFAAAFSLLLVFHPHVRAESEGLPPSAFFLSIEPLLVDSEGIHPIGGTKNELVEIGTRGGFHQTIELGKNDGDHFVYSLLYQMGSEERIRFSLKRFLTRNGKEEEFPIIKHDMRPLETWTETVLEDTGEGSRIDLRVIPVIRPSVSDESFEEKKIKMYFQGGPLIRYGEEAGSDRIVFRELNVRDTTGLQLGIPGVGTVKLSHRLFPGFKECGWVRGHRLFFEFGENVFSAWSETLILPEDPTRPGKGWKIYGTLDPDPSLAVEDRFYGGFELHS